MMDKFSIGLRHRVWAQLVKYMKRSLPIGGYDFIYIVV